MIVKVLMENTAVSEKLSCEHGLSLYVETGGHKLLFDFGQSDACLKNAAEIGVDLSRVDAAFLSHGHYDHGGGIAAFLKLNARAKIYVNENAAGDFFSHGDTYIGLDKDALDQERIVFTSDETRISDDLVLRTYNGLPRPYPGRGGGLTARDKDGTRPDAFLHEQYLLATEGRRRVLFSGCSHKGIQNILNFARDFDPTDVIGGLHLMNVPDDADGRRELEALAGDLLESNAVFYTGHCTGLAQYAVLKRVMGERLYYLSGGCTLTLE